MMRNSPTIEGHIMARKKPYTKKLAVLDVILFFLTGGAWIVIALVREFYMRNS